MAGRVTPFSATSEKRISRPEDGSHLSRTAILVVRVLGSDAGYLQFACREVGRPAFMRIDPHGGQLGPGWRSVGVTTRPLSRFLY